MEREVLVKRKTLEMLPAANESIAKLQDLCSAGTQRLVELAQQWDEHRLPLVQQLREKEDLQTQRRERGRLMVDEIKRYRQDMAAMIQDLRDKQERAQLLSEEKGKLNKSINRAMYTHRIMDITSQLAKQNVDIDKITSDIRDIQKTINQNSSTLQLADAVAEELIYTAANDKNDPVMVDTYRRLKTLRSKFEELVETVRKTGQQGKANRDLETKIDQEQSRISANNADRIKADLVAIVQENAQLVAQIKSLSSKR
ncbi:hypothetical protein B484DRAFT_340964 [Ochromonadaceae sp. CCMP2298]|nr:hypothetical protein B484DRAFT_340964 [Ochromonadaceae sp. CCMP2298]